MPAFFSDSDIAALHSLGHFMGGTPCSSALRADLYWRSPASHWLHGRFIDAVANGWYRNDHLLYAEDDVDRFREGQIQSCSA